VWRICPIGAGLSDLAAPGPQMGRVREQQPRSSAFHTLAWLLPGARSIYLGVNASHRLLAQISVGTVACT